MEHEEAMELACQWHTELQEAYENDQLAEEDERHLCVHAIVEELLSDNEEFAAIAQEAEQQGINGHNIRHALGRAFLFGLWYHKMEGIDFDPDVMARWFQNELRKVPQCG